MNSAIRFASPAVALALAGFVVTGLTSTIPAAQPDMSTMAKRTQAGPVAQPRVTAQFTQDGTVTVSQAAPDQAQIQTQTQSQARQAVAAAADHNYYNRLRSQLNWVDVRMGADRLKTPDQVSRIVLAQSAAARAGLEKVGLSFRDVYGIINAETSWIPRMGASKDGTPNLGIAQFEPATAKALGLANPQDPVEAIHVAALHMKEAAVWSARKLEGLKLSPAAREAKLREGVSVYYNLSTKGRSLWNGKNTAKLPIETQRHISNAAIGAREAAVIEAQLGDVRMHDTMQAVNGRGGNMLRVGG